LKLRFLLFSAIFVSMLGATSMKIMFAGDIMGHSSQIASAYNYKTKSYQYDEVFSKVAPIFKRADFAVANLELTFGGKPYGGFPRFSSPDSLAKAIKSANINVLVTANNHSADRGCRGIKRTIDILDENSLLHTGTFKSEDDRKRGNLLILQKENLKVGLLNYTQDTNGIYVRKPCIVNLIKKEQIKRDIEEAKKEVDKLIVFLHWGEQYRFYPNRFQKKLAKFLINSGVDIVIGSHPHVLQPMFFDKNSSSLIAYSLGNFISNQQRVGRDGGAILEVTLTKDSNSTKISDAKYYLTWVKRYYSKGKRRYQIIPYSQEAVKSFKMRSFIKLAKGILKNSNIDLATTTKEFQKTIALNYFNREVFDEVIVP